MHGKRSAVQVGDGGRCAGMAGKVLRCAARKVAILCAACAEEVVVMGCK